MEMDGLDCAKCQKIKKRDMMGIMGIVNDNKTKDEQCHILHFENKWAMAGRVCAESEI